MPSLEILRQQELKAALEAENERELHTKGVPVEELQFGAPDPDPEWRERAAMEQAALPSKQRVWDDRYLDLCRFWADRCSKDPSTRVGACIVSADGRREYLGYNGFPRGVEDSTERLEDRPVKYKLVVHAEMNALMKAGTDAIGGTLYCTLFTCNECAKHLIQAGIKRIVARQEGSVERWGDSHEYAMLMYNEAGVAVELV